MLRKMVQVRPGATGSVGSRRELLLPLKTLVTVSFYTLLFSFTPCPNSWTASLPSPKVWSTATPLTSRSPAAKCFRLVSLRGDKVLSFASSKLWGPHFQHLWNEFKLPIPKATCHGSPLRMTGYLQTGIWKLLYISRSSGDG